MKSNDSPQFPRGVSGESLPKAAPINDFGDGAQRPVLTVTELNRRVRGMLEAQFELRWVAGEISNLMRAASGHWYFSLKDQNAQVRCVMFRHRAQSLGFIAENGMQVEVRALPSLYEPKGEFQLGVETMRRAGLGALFEAFERLKAMLSREGLFDVETKRALPGFARVIGVITSTKAAVLHDVLTTMLRRAPMVRVIIYPTAVQGANAPAEICAALETATRRASGDQLDALLLCRGGGSIEDLWCFNDESVARAIHAFRNATRLPLVSAVGHETDFTIADFVADLRAPTPTAAAELLTPDTPALRIALTASRQALARAQARQLARLQQRIDHAARGLLSPQQRLAQERGRLDHLRLRLAHALRACIAAQDSRLLRQQQTLQRLSPRLSIDQHRLTLSRRRDRLARGAAQSLAVKKSRIEASAQALSHLNPAAVLARGYALVQDERGAILRDARALTRGDGIRVRLARGRVVAVVSAVDIEAP